MPDDQQKPARDVTPAGIASDGARGVLVATLTAAIIAMIVIAGFKAP